jgi:CTP synthase
MTIVIVEDDASEPALFGAMAAVVARSRHAPILQLSASLQRFRDPDAVQHVAEASALVASGLLWHERLSAASIEPDAGIAAILARSMTEDVVIPFHPTDAAVRHAIVDLVARAQTSGQRVEHLRVVDDRDGRRVIGASSDAEIGDVGRWRRDQFGRFHCADEPNDVLDDAHRLRIGLIGSRHDSVDVYPATLAALGDAADELAQFVEIVFIAPTDLRPGDEHAVVRELDGVLLPGGADMANVPGQILMARTALEAGIPTVGLCLGMQTMVTAVAQTALGSRAANLAEADPDAPIKTFVPIGPATDDTATHLGGLIHRVGTKRMNTRPGTHLAGLLGTDVGVRYNHRFRLNTDLVPALNAAGLVISACDETGEIADAIELPEHPFYMGMQGHPELSSRRGHPHPLLRAFVTASSKFKTKSRHRP